MGVAEGRGGSGEGCEEMGRCREGKSAGLCSEATHNKYNVWLSCCSKDEILMRSLARMGFLGPTLRESTEAREEVESLMMEKGGKL